LIITRLQLANVDFGDKFRGGFPELLEILNKVPEVKNGSRQLIILIDAVNEYGEPKEFLEELIRFIKDLPYPWIKVMMSIRTFAWESLKDKYIFESDTFYHSRDVSGKPIPFVSLHSFNDGELELAYGQYKEWFNIESEFQELSDSTKRLLRNPLLLRFASEAYEGRVFPSRLFTAQIFAQYRKERINRDDQFFLDYLARRCGTLERMSFNSVCSSQLNRKGVGAY